MVFIEKIKIEKHTGLSKATLIDMFCADYTVGFYAGFWHQQLKEVYGETFQQLSNDYGLYFAKKYGTSGIDVNIAIASSENNTDVVFEISDYDLVYNLPEKKARALLEKCNVLVHDYVEGGTFLNSNLLEWLNKLKDSKNLKPKNLYIHTSNYNWSEWDFGMPNITILPHTSMFGLFTASHIPNLYDDPDNVYLHYCYDHRMKKFHNSKALILNRKPRFSRVKFLANLYAADVLKHCHWTLAWYKEDEGEVVSWEDNKKLETRRAWNTSINISENQKHTRESDDAEVKQFLNDWEDLLPINCDYIPSVNIADSRRFYWDWCKHKWGVSLEVLTARDNANYPNPQGFLTEKTWRFMALGMIPLIVAPIGAENELRHCGFKIPEFPYEIYSGLERNNAVSDFLIEDLKTDSINMSKYAQDCFHNMQLIRDKAHMVRLLLKSLFMITV